jgi:LysR family transcriptional regulator, nitrogen assimilation regulatory protein
MALITNADHLLRTFMQVARSGSLREAAETLDVSQPALSNQIRNLERQIGSELFTRHGRGLRLNSTGLELLKRIEGSFAEIDLALGATIDSHRTTIQTLTIASVQTVGSYLLAELASRFSTEFPKLRLALLTASSPDVVTMVERGQADIGIVYDLAVVSDDVAITPFLDEELAVYCRSDHALGGLESVLALAGQPLILPPKEFALRRILERELQDALNVAIECNSIEVTLSLVERGLGLAVLPAQLPDALVIAHQLKRISFSASPLVRKLVCICRARASTQRPIEAFNAFIKVQIENKSLRTRVS